MDYIPAGMTSGWFIHRIGIRRQPSNCSPILGPSEQPSAQGRIKAHGGEEARSLRHTEQLAGHDYLRVYLVVQLLEARRTGNYGRVMKQSKATTRAGLVRKDRNAHQTIRGNIPPWTNQLRDHVRGDISHDHASPIARV